MGLKPPIVLTMGGRASQGQVQLTSPARCSFAGPPSQGFTQGLQDYPSGRMVEILIPLPARKHDVRAEFHFR